jgi:hypothetical protein
VWGVGKFYQLLNRLVLGVNQCWRFDYDTAVGMNFDRIYQQINKTIRRLLVGLIARFNLLHKPAPTDEYSRCDRIPYYTDS